jgi:hypothetical protein
MNAKQRRREKFLRGEQKSHLPSFIRRREKPNIFGIATAAPVFFRSKLTFSLPQNNENDLTEGPYRRNLLSPANTEPRRKDTGNGVQWRSWDWAQEIMSKRGVKKTFFSFQKGGAVRRAGVGT